MLRYLNQIRAREQERGAGETANQDLLPRKLYLFTYLLKFTY